jgi:hypothetical protein
MILYQTQEAADDVWGYIDAVKTEIGGLGYVRRESDDCWVWYETFLIPQEVSGSSIDYNSDALVYAIERATKDDVLGNPDFSWVQWHSHAGMDVFWSSTDTDDQIDAMRKASGLPHLFSFVGNHAGKYKCRLDIWDHELVPHLTIDIDCGALKDVSWEAHIAAEIKEHVTPKKWPVKHVTKPQTTHSTGWSPAEKDDDTEYVKGTNGTWRPESEQFDTQDDDYNLWHDLDWDKTADLDPDALNAYLASQGFSIIGGEIVDN